VGRLFPILFVCGALLMLIYLVSYGWKMSYYRSVGGLPSIGKVEGGRYYVGNHGAYTEVSEEDWNRGVALERWSLASFALVFLVSLLLAIYGLSRARGKAQPNRFMALIG
jgi:hypothetical protein